MNVRPILVTEEGALIPLEYLQGAEEFEIEIQNGNVLVRPKFPDQDQDQPKRSWMYEWIGIGETRDPTASERVEEILEAEIDRRAGWTLDPYPEDEP